MVLPSFEGPELDFVLVDGDHAFPTPFIDWYYAAERLRVGGRMMIDDIPLRTGAVLDDFLSTETTRWRAVRRLPRTVVYEKLTTTVIDFAGWMSQPWCMQPTSLAGRARALLRVRTRLRALRRGSP
jgi:predicted O-methyltransferase YrrM